MIKSSYDTTLDDLDRQILKELQEDGRLSSVELARRVGLSTSATHARIKRLEQDGYVDRYVALLNWEQAG
ncbi:MAG: winged helix-turn-helix transcriptional regulator, partial [Anaerolineae bacterium]|nr:winged helix-turn-helix transcriptional regulator [Anaerolineae bacterium]